MFAHASWPAIEVTPFQPFMFVHLHRMPRAARKHMLKYLPTTSAVHKCICYGFLSARRVLISFILSSTHL